MSGHLDPATKRCENASAVALSKHDPALPIDCRIFNPAHKVVNDPAV